MKSTINSRLYIIGFIGDYFENMHINPLPGVRFLETSFLELTMTC